MSDRTDDRIPIIAEHRGVGIHAWQTPARVEIVKLAIDVVYALPSIAPLLAFLQDSTQPPEARLFAAARLRAMHELAAESRIGRPKGIDPEWLDAYTAGLDSRSWVHPWKYTSLLDHDHRNAVERETPLVDREGRSLV